MKNNKKKFHYVYCVPEFPRMSVILSRRKSVVYSGPYFSDDVLSREM
jgi:hypothetical protein